MLFSGLPFLYYFLPAVLVCYFAAPRKLKNAVLFVFSLIFYGWGEPRYIVLMIVSIVSGFVFALMIEKNEEQKTRKLWMWAECLVLLGLLIFFNPAPDRDLSGRPALISMNNAVRHCFGDRCLHVCHFLQNRIHLRHKRSHCHPCKSLILRSAVKNYFHLVKIFHYIIPSS